MTKEEIRNELQQWIQMEERAGRTVDIDAMNMQLQVIVGRHNNMPDSRFNGLSPNDMQCLLHTPFSTNCVVQLVPLNAELHEQIPLIRQALRLMNILSETELKLTPNGWLPLKIVSELYPLGAPDEFIEFHNPKRINEYQVNSVWMSRLLLDVLGWVKTRKGKLSLTAKGRKALSNTDAATEVLYTALTAGVLHTFDRYEDDRPGNVGVAYSLWLLNKFGSEWHSGNFYQDHYLKVFDFPATYNIYSTRVFERLFYWLGLVEQRQDPKPEMFFSYEFRKTDLLSKLFTFSKA